jgi:hypothetical protein
MNSAHVFIINGRPRAGKDSLAGFMDLAYQKLGYTPTHFSSIDPVRDGLANMGIDVSQKTAADRLLLASLGALVEEHSQFRSKSCLNAVSKAVLTTPSPVVFMMIREAEIIQRVRKELNNRGHFVYRVLVHSARSETPTNPVDAAVHDMGYDFLVHNFGTLYDLQKEAQALVNLIHMRRQEDMKDVG